jgi:nicotinate phosphoribosyltransferase
LGSGGLDEDAVAALVAAGAPIDAYGIGTRMGVSADAPSLDSAYKLVVYGDHPVLKLSPGKATFPGAKQVFRPPTAEAADILALRAEPVPDGHQALLVPVMRAGCRVNAADPASEIRAARNRFDADLARLPPAAPRPGSAHVSPAPAGRRACCAEPTRLKGDR